MLSAGAKRKKELPAEEEEGVLYEDIQRPRARFMKLEDGPYHGNICLVVTRLFPTFHL